MSFGTLLAKYCSVVGLNATASRALAVSRINDAAKELYKSGDLPGCLRELTCQVDANYQITLPSYVGALRGMRNPYWGAQVKVLDMRPRYSNSPWKDAWRGWRLKGLVPVAYDIVNSAPMTLSVAAVETPNVVVTINGSTADSSRISESVTMNSTSEVLANSFQTILSITKDRASTYNITLTDASGRVMAVIANADVENWYRMVDVSAYPYFTVTYPNAYIDVLYKERLLPFTNDSDVMPSPEFEEAVFYKALSLWYLTQENQAGNVALYEGKANQLFLQGSIDDEGVAEKTLQFEDPGTFYGSEVGRRGLFPNSYPGWGCP